MIVNHHGRCKARPTAKILKDFTGQAFVQADAPLQRSFLARGHLQQLRLCKLVIPSFDPFQVAINQSDARNLKFSNAPVKLETGRRFGRGCKPIFIGDSDTAGVFCQLV